MPDDTKTTRESQSSPSSMPWALTSGPLSITSQRAFETWAHGMSRLFHDMAEFMQLRLLEDSAMWEKLAACRDPKLALEFQRQFATKLSADYTAAGQKFARLIMEIGQSCGVRVGRTPPETD